MLRAVWTSLRPLGVVLPWPLVNARAALVSHGASVFLLGGLLASRLLLLPSGPWEQDEALLASGVLDFDPAHHMPLPPGFPLWVLLGRVVRVLGVADPLVALQVASAVLSVLAAWALIGAGEPLIGRPLALAAGLAVSFVPGVWFHSVRAFSETPSAALAVVALALWLRCGQAGFVPGVVVMTCAALVRPPLAPFFVVTVLLAAWGSRRRPRQLVTAAVAALTLSAVVLTVAALEAGGFAMLVSSSAIHGSEHMALLGTEPSTLTGLGVVRGLGGIAPACTVILVAAIGWFALRRALGWRWWAGSVASLWLAYLLLFLHNRTYPRYWVLVWLAMALPAAAGLRWLTRRGALAAAVLTVAGVVGASWTWPALRHVHRNRLPVVAAMQTVASEGDGTLVFEDQLFSFRNLLAREGRLGVASLRVSEIPPRRLNLAGQPLWFLTQGDGSDVDSPASEVFQYGCGEPRVWALSQQRFLTARLVRNPVLVWQGGSIPEWEGTRRFVWCEGRSKLLVPPVDAGGNLTLAAEIHPALGEVEVAAKVDGIETLRERRHPGLQVLRIPLPQLDKRIELNQVVPVELTVSREVRFAGDLRKLAVRIFRVSVEAPPYTPHAWALFPEERSLVFAFATAAGTYPPELLGSPPRPAAWTGPRATLSFPVGDGLVGVELLAARPEPARVEVRFGPSRFLAEVSNELARVALAVPPEFVRRGRGELEITTSTFEPGGGDTRELGVAVSRVWYVPSRP